MWYEAAYWRRDPTDEERPSLDAMLEDRHYARYVDAWGRPGDVAIGALDSGDEPIGAAWYRHFPADDAGYGFVAPDVPEISIAVYPEHRGHQVGSLLLGSLVQRARDRGEPAVSLSVEIDNPALQLYERFGFRPHGERVVAGGQTMVLDLRGNP